MSDIFIPPPPKAGGCGCGSGGCDSGAGVSSDSTGCGSGGCGGSCSSGSSEPSAFMQRIYKLIPLIFLMGLSMAPSLFSQEARFPKPEFETGYDFPATTTPVPETQFMEYLDVALLFITLSLAAWFDLKKRSRRGLFGVMLFSLAYFGFYRHGCVCAIGAIQNVSFSIFSNNYAVPVTVLLFFSVPLVYAMFFGRVYCASVCPLGAIQDLVLLKPIKIPTKVSQALGTIPYIYLGVGVLLAATGSAFIICRYDPFIGFFRLNGNAPYLYLGAIFLAIGVFIGRPYCRFFCPYGVLLGWMSKFSKWHLSITPTECVQCRLCEDSCPFDYIHKPNSGLVREERRVGVRRLGYILLAVPALTLFGGWVGNKASVPLARANNTIDLAETVLLEQEDLTREPTLYTDTFRSMGKAEPQLMEEALELKRKMGIGGWIVGGLIGLFFGVRMFQISTTRHRKDYEADKTKCFSCGRCYPYCPSDAMHTPNFLEV